ncbi:GIY-YIG catalytic domain-containing endonuclease [Paramecium bursaria Chlorella virus NY2B]|nr:GIY-YIG catalytic domain-containing endonuclease [Paramecium bursaria Chlorella virus IL-5-2s1]AGE58336.1 GIY-YIG catalytic domain-containing endonuclease [Paramecium bursaria Chlorella virus NY2B]
MTNDTRIDTYSFKYISSFEFKRSMGNYAYFYIWTLRTDGYQYVGVTTRKIEERIREHCNKSSGCTKLRNAIQKYRVDAFDIEYFEWCDEYDLAYIEMILIEELDTLSPNGFNLKKGGGKYGSLSEETKKKLSEAKTGEKNGMFGKSRSDETKKKHSESITGEKHHASKKVYQYDSDGNYIRSFGSYSEAGRSIGKSHKYISRCARGEKEPECSFRWSTQFIPDLARWTYTITQ